MRCAVVADQVRNNDATKARCQAPAGPLGPLAPTLLGYDRGSVLYADHGWQRAWLKRVERLMRERAVLCGAIAMRAYGTPGESARGSVGVAETLSVQAV